MCRGDHGPVGSDFSVAEAQSSAQVLAQLADNHAESFRPCAAPCTGEFQLAEGVVRVSSGCVTLLENELARMKDEDDRQQPPARLNHRAALPTVRRVDMDELQALREALRRGSFTEWREQVREPLPQTACPIP